MPESPLALACSMTAYTFRMGVIPAYRVDDITVVVRESRDLGGRAGSLETRPFGLAVDFCFDDQGTQFHL